MSGRGALGAVPFISSERILVCRAGELEIASEPLHTDPDAAIGPGMSFATHLLERSHIERVILVPCAVGGTWIDRWTPGADLFLTAVDETAAATRHGNLGGILWHQGEANAADHESASAYGEDLEAVIRGFRKAFGVRVPFVAGEIGRFLGEYGGCPEFRRINRSIHDVCNSAPLCATVSAEGLGHTGDFLHFNARAARALGIRYADAWSGICHSESGPSPPAQVG